eukprot:jgi/Ulvmu1/9328/UM050_0078.1
MQRRGDGIPVVTCVFNPQKVLVGRRSSICVVCIISQPLYYASMTSVQIEVYMTDPRVATAKLLALLHLWDWVAFGAECWFGGRVLACGPGCDNESFCSYQLPAFIMQPPRDVGPQAFNTSV